MQYDFIRNTVKWSRFLNFSQIQLVDVSYFSRKLWSPILEIYITGYAVRVGATGAIVPVNFQKWQIASVNYE